MSERAIGAGRKTGKRSSLAGRPSADTSIPLVTIASTAKGRSLVKNTARLVRTRAAALSRRLSDSMLEIAGMASKRSLAS
jgi:hypothetical protein